jgi:hypothetical protein
VCGFGSGGSSKYNYESCCSPSTCLQCDKKHIVHIVPPLSRVKKLTRSSWATDVSTLDPNQRSNCFGPTLVHSGVSHLSYEFPAYFTSSSIDLLLHKCMVPSLASHSLSLKCNSIDPVTNNYVYVNAVASPSQPNISSKSSKVRVATRICALFRMVCYNLCHRPAPNQYTLEKPSPPPEATVVSKQVIYLYLLDFFRQYFSHLC